ncbi:MAG: hypothetical protein HZA93_19985 [Verrucomicrobia bacterium]|nr:hypothetical protein [Verrucomicrobiota bacterium]
MHPSSLRLIFVCLVCFVVSHLAAADAEFVRVWPQWREAESFDRIGEYFGGKESTEKEIILRTHADVRAGYYFLARIATPTALTGTRFDLQVIRPDAPEPKTFSFPANVRAGGAVFELGLTGADWPKGKAAHPVAWKLALVAADGRVLAEQKSFLWEKPAK